MPAERRNNFYEQFAATAERFPTRPAVEVQRRDSLDRFTYADLRSMADHVAGFLAAHGSPGASRLGRGDGCAILADNDARWCAAYLGVLAAGQPIDPEDFNWIQEKLDSIYRKLGALEIAYVPDPNNIPGAWFADLADIVAGECASKFGLVGQELMDKIIAYNKEDLEATWAVFQWLKARQSKHG